MSQEMEKANKKLFNKWVARHHLELRTAEDPLRSRSRRDLPPTPNSWLACFRVLTPQHFWPALPVPEKTAVLRVLRQT